MTSVHRTLAWLAVVVVAAAAGLVRGQAFPDRTITIVAPAPGAWRKRRRTATPCSFTT